MECSLPRAHKIRNESTNNNYIVHVYNSHTVQVAGLCWVIIVEWMHLIQLQREMPTAMTVQADGACYSNNNNNNCCRCEQNE